MSVFTNSMAGARGNARAYTEAILGLLGDKPPMSVLPKTAAALRKAVAGMSPRQLGKREAPGKWSVRHVLQHLVDSDIVWSWRLRLILSQDRPPLTGYDQDAWADRLGYDKTNVAQALDEFAVLRSANLRLLKRASPADLKRVGVHVERGEESVEHLMKLYAGHDLLHLNQIRRIRRAIMAVVVLVAGAFAQPLAAQTAHTLWVTLGDSDQLVEVDPVTFRALRRIKVDERPHGLASSPDGSKIYLASDKTGNFQVVDVRSGRVVAQIPIGNDPNQMAITKDGRFAYVPIRGEHKVAVVQLDPLRLVKKLPSPEGPHDAYTSPDGSRIYVGAQYGTGIVVIDPAKQEVLHVIPTPAGVRPMRPSPDGKSLYVALSKLVGFVVVDPEARRITRTVTLGTLPQGVPDPYKDTWTHDLHVSPDGRELWVTDDVHDLLRVVRLSDMKEVAQIQTGHFPHWFAMRPDGRVLFVSLWFSDAVAAVDIANRKVLHHIQFERQAGPKRIMVAPRPR